MGWQVLRLLCVVSVLTSLSIGQDFDAVICRNYDESHCSSTLECKTTQGYDGHCKWPEGAPAGTPCYCSTGMGEEETMPINDLSVGVAALGGLVILLPRGRRKAMSDREA